MATLKDIHSELSHSEWAEQIQECQSSGQTVKEWCKGIGISPSTYYNRLRAVREEMLSRQPKLHEIVPVSVSTELAENNAVLSEKSSFSDKPKSTEKIIIRKNSIEIEIPCDADEHIITAMLRGLKEC
ncbi:MAG: IS66 family insertion sequence element accessory protein TnpB [Ruminococcus sp.]|nr:IS66 family insertion sequence element accessory protein TnpB [Ruminococcus sp.]